jgi:hypothetical protein
MEERSRRGENVFSLLFISIALIRFPMHSNESQMAGHFWITPGLG